MPLITDMNDKPATGKTILLHYGSGGAMTQELIGSLFVKAFRNRVLEEMTDSAVLRMAGKSLAFTTDSFVVDPVFFPGGDIGKLAVCGTVNDLSVSGAKPVYLSASFIIEEGLPFSDLEKIVQSMAREAKKAGVTIVTGDTKVVNRGKCDKIFINTAGIGILDKSREKISSGSRIRPGDRILINGTIGDHGMAVLQARESLPFTSKLRSDCTSLNHFIGNLMKVSGEIKFMRDATRGGAGTVLCEIADRTGLGMEITEQAIPVRSEVKGMCELLGFDPLYLANEGKVIAVVSARDSEKVLKEMKKQPEGKRSAIIGEIVRSDRSKVILNTVSGGRRFIERMQGDQLPRIC